MQPKPAPSVKPERVTIHYPVGLYWSAVLLALVSIAIHLYFGIFVYSGTNMIPMLGIAAVYLVGAILVVANVRRTLWLKVGVGWASLLVILWAAAAFLGNAHHTMDLLAFAVNGVEVVLILVLLTLMRYSKVVSST